MNRGRHRLPGAKIAKLRRSGLTGSVHASHGKMRLSPPFLARSSPCPDARPTAVRLGPRALRTLDTRTELSETGIVKGGEFERRVRKLARTRKVLCQFVADRGKGSHGRLYFGDEFTTLKDRKKEIGRDLLAKMCADLKIDSHDI